MSEKVSAPIADSPSPPPLPVSAIPEASQKVEAIIQTEPSPKPVSPEPTTSASKPDPKPYVIDRDLVMVVMGATGVGKTTFINTFKASYSLETDGYHGLESGTKDIDVYTFKMPGDINLVLVDTPGFDDSKRTNADILKCISKYLEERYRTGKLLDGLIYLHRITDIRFDAGAATALNIFRKLYGSDGYDKLALVTTMWNDIRPDLQYKYIEKERELQEGSWGTFLKRDDAAFLGRFDSTEEDGARTSSLNVVEELAKRSLREKLKLKLQKELVDDKIRLPMTEAGKAAFSLAEMAKYYLNEITS
ncbi:P-loop containing nucleoside triphosphate hydrolase protein [Panaeolus papilionaceus]|nr:P-loop containing nucleoside triphosphate hydrolase protein [Panaeolus papilionaceus]